MAWCETNRVDFVFGSLAMRGWSKRSASNSCRPRQASATGKPARRFRDFRYATLDSCRAGAGRRQGGMDKRRGHPRFIVTSLNKAETSARFLYEKVYCARGEMENRIKECQGDLFAHRTSTATGANQLRLWLASFAYALLCALGASVLPTPSSPKRPAAQSGSSSSSSPVSSASARAHQIRARLSLSLRRRMAARRRPPRHNRRRVAATPKKRGNPTHSPPETPKRPTPSAQTAPGCARPHYSHCAIIVGRENQAPPIENPSEQRPPPKL